MKKLRVTIDGKAYEVVVEILDQGDTPSAVAAPAAASIPPAASAPLTAAPFVATTPKAPSAGAGSIVSPLAGKIVSIDVKLGQSVDEGAQVATIEAMKMNTYIYAPKVGQVAEIFVNAGDAVEEGAPLLRLS